MPINLECKAILFDMDGTLVDSTAVVEMAWERWAARYGIPLDEVLRFSHGRPTVATLEHFRPGADHASEEADMLRYEETQTVGIVPVPGAPSVVSAAQSGAWAVVTSAPRRLAEIRIAAAGLPGLLVPVDEIQRGKPDPEGYLRAAHHFGVEAQECLVFEDTGPGIEAGLRAGMQVVGLLTTVPREQLPCDYVVRDFRDVKVTPNERGFHVAIHSV